MTATWFAREVTWLSNRTRRWWLAGLALGLATVGAVAASAVVEMPQAQRPAAPPATVPPAQAAEAGSAVRFVAPSGSDAAPGTPEEPWRSLQHALTSISAGQTLYVRGGTYTENVHVTGSQVHPGTSTRPIHVLAYPGERPVVEGLLWLTNPSYWYLDGISVTWSRANSSDDHMVKLLGGTGWRFGNAELWGARSYAALLVGRGATDFLVDHNFIHDTYASNDENQDHLMYIDNGPDGSGVIEQNILARSPNGRGVKLGPGSLDQPGTDNIVIRYNTFYDNRGPSNIQLSGSSSDNQVYGNLLDEPADGSANITAWNLTGRNNVVRDNLGGHSAGVADFDSDGFVDGGGNVHADPKLTDPARDDFTPQQPKAARYGSAEAAADLVEPRAP